MNFIKKHQLIFVLAVAALMLRLINLDKAGGLWYDEATIYSIASKSFPTGMMQADSHRFLLFPLYYFVYNLWINIIGNSDFLIRFMSVFFDVLSIGAAYFAGMAFGEFLNKDEKFSQSTGLTYALLYTLNSSFIYYAQEAKFYSMTFLLVNILIVFWLKFLKNQDTKSFIPFYLANLFLIYTYTSQILLTIIILLVTGIYFLKEKVSRSNLKYLLILLTVYIPLCLLGLYIKNYFSGNFSAVVYDNSFILIALQDYFTPLLAGVQNNVLKYQYVWLKGLFNPVFWIFVFFPIIFILSQIIKICIKSKEARILLSVPVSYLLIHILLSNFSEYKVLVRYTLMILPFLLLLAALGIDSIKNNILRKTLLVLFVVVSFLGINSNYGAVNIPRPDGYRLPGLALQQYKVNPEANFILPIRPDLLDKYFTITGEKLSLYTLNSEEAQKTYLTQDEISGIKNDKQNPYKYYRRYLLSDKISPDFVEYIMDNFVEDGHQIVVMTDKSISMYTDEQIKTIVNSKNYQGYPLQFLRLSKLNNDLLKVLHKEGKLQKKIMVNNWEIFVFDI